MSGKIQKITPCLWFDKEAEEAAKHYVSIFANSRIGSVARYTGEGKDIHGKDEGTVMTVEFELDGQRFTALNGGPQFPFTEAISLQVGCADQEEVDYYWAHLSEGGEEGPCGWLKDRYGLSWQIVPDVLPQLLSGDPEGAARVTQAFMKMKKFDIAALKQAYAGH